LVDPVERDYVWDGLAVGRWFDDNLVRVVGDENKTFFCSNVWIGDEVLHVRYMRLFE